MAKQNDNTSISTSHVIDDLIDQLSLEPSKEMEALKELIFNSPDNNQAKIDFIKEEITAGRYQIEAKSIAMKLLEEQFILADEPEALA
ncbi:flagellar biosynthesis anti-sigma factor FlgM [Legionella yabuuchiae]|uniref:flagellar biosynthesis anti-sigma factor FlgM n=1 Tax=Legionella yabuuchiae TaxID=376727 RepID=UPI001054E1C4|nr:flagellar biosynthesis anti-sigma factor FlgM [Legionella yabuuchiae]